MQGGEGDKGTGGGKGREAGREEGWGEREGETPFHPNGGGKGTKPTEPSSIQMALKKGSPN